MNADPRIALIKATRIAFVYPPFGPAGLPSLGMGLLAAQAEAAGLQVRQIYWNLEYLCEHLLPDGQDRTRALAAYRIASARGLFPFNEWVFADIAYDKPDLRRSEAEAELARLAPHLERQIGDLLTDRDLKRCKESAADCVRSMADRLAGFDIVAISTSFFQNLAALSLARALKTLPRPPLLLFGGANCDGEMGPSLLKQFNAIDAVFVGEADEVFARALPALARMDLSDPSLSPLDGLVRRDATGQIIGKPAKPINALDALIIPDFDDYVETRGALGLDEAEPLCLAVESSRGCWWGERAHCTFCGLNANGMAYRAKSFERFADEVSTLQARHKAQYFFATDNIVSRDYFSRISAWSDQRGIDMSFFYEIKSNMKRADVRALRKGQVDAVQPGIESFSTPLLRRMNKGVSGLQNVAFLKYAREEGLLAVYNILTAFPGESPEEYDQMLAYMPHLSHLQPPNSAVPIEFHRFSPYHNAPETYGLRLKGSRAYRYLYPFDQDEIDQLAYIFQRQDDAPTASNEVRQRLDRLILHWRSVFQPETCTLTWARDGGRIHIQDRRNGNTQDYVLTGTAAQVFERLESPTTLRAIGAEIPRETPETLPTSPHAPGAVSICFSREAFLDSPEHAIAPLLQAGLCLSEGAKFLALPVAADFRPLSDVWKKVGI